MDPITYKQANTSYIIVPLVMNPSSIPSIPNCPK